MDRACGETPSGDPTIIIVRRGSVGDCDTFAGRVHVEWEEGEGQR